MITQQQIIDALMLMKGPDGKTPLPHSSSLSGVTVRENKAFVAIEVDPRGQEYSEHIRQEVETRLRGLPGIGDVLVTLTAERAPPVNHPAKPTSSRQKPIDNVRFIVAIASGKGGVGKSTVAANLALALVARGWRTGLLDADIYGPSVPTLFDVHHAPAGENKRIVPIERHGLKLMSIGFMIEPEAAMIWRGPMIMSALTQLLRDVTWGELDCLVVDLPPGTGDAQLTLAQSVPLSGVIVVSTPQDLALMDARRGMSMFERLEVPILGLIENMSYFICPHCHERSDIFGHGGARHEAQRRHIPFLGEVPLDMAFRETGDQGHPLVVTAPDSAHAGIFLKLAQRLQERLQTEG